MEIWMASILVVLFSLVSYCAGYGAGKQTTTKQLREQYIDSHGYKKGEFQTAYINKEPITIAWYSDQNCWVQIVKHNEDAR